MANDSSMQTQETGSSLYDILKAEYGKVEVLPNGMYKVGKERVQMWIPADTTNLSDVAIWYPGGGGEGKDATEIKKLCNGSNPPNYIVAVSSFSGNTGGTNGNIFTRVTDSLNNCGISVDKGAGIAFSDSGNTMLKQFNESVRGDADQASRFELFEVEGAWVDSKRCSSSNLDAIAEYDVPVHYISGRNNLSESYKASAEYLNSQGVNCSFITSSTKSHLATNADFWKSNFLDYCFGNTDEIGSKPNYTMHNYDNGNWTEGSMTSVRFGSGTTQKKKTITLDLPKTEDAATVTQLSSTNEQISTNIQTVASDNSSLASASYSSGYSGGGAGDIDLPTPAELDYVINKIASVKDTLGSALSAQISGFSTMGLDLGSAGRRLSSLTKSFNSVVGRGSTLDEAYSILKNVENKLREMDNNYDLYVAIDYLENINANGGNISLLGADVADADQQEIFSRLTQTLENNKDKLTVDASTGNTIVGLAAGATLTTDNNMATATVKDPTTLQAKNTSLNNMLNTLVKDYAGVKTFERKAGGGLFIEKDGSYAIGIPANYYGQAMDTIVFFDDGGGSGGVSGSRYDQCTSGKLDRTNFRTSTGQVDTLMASNPNTVVAASKFGSKDIDEMLNVMDTVGINSNHTIVSGFSAGGNAAVYGAENILKNHTNLKNVELLLLDSNNLDQVSGKTIQYLADNNVKVTTLNSLEEKYVKRQYHYLTDKGIDLSVIHTDRTKDQINVSWHTDHKFMAFNDNIYGYLLGNNNAPTTSQSYGSGYQYAHYNPTTSSLEAYTPQSNGSVIRLASGVNNVPEASILTDNNLNNQNLNVENLNNQNLDTVNPDNLASPTLTKQTISTNNVTYLSKNPAAFKTLNGTDYYLGATKLDSTHGKQQGYMAVDGYEFSTDSSSGTVYIKYTDNNGKQQNCSYYVGDYHLGGLAVNKNKSGEMEISFATGDNITTYKVDDLINYDKKDSSTTPKVVAQSTPGDLKVGNNQSGRVSWIGNAGNGEVMAGQYQNAKANGTSPYKNNGISSSNIAFYSQGSDGSWNQKSVYSINGDQMTNLQGGCKGDDGYCYFTSSTASGNSKLYIAKLNDSTKTVDCLGSVDLPPGAEEVSYTDGKLTITYEGTDAKGNSANGYVSHIDPNALKDNLNI